ncbi:MAG: response regulator [Cyclobacteriaceae bacterium]|nr:response regulator [Cyclobacteriaceae bacterium]MCB0498762.1 response regulator [Cyclobacteriaceae bacterium]MCB9237724.1 response regulator [Flammeovirgaceae bacterium]MCO5270174.1 response regulator [Cyclobacteriaceae bacterium]MCW5903753.1 response regulator [Cyclobacteriaceae bacterium]
MMKRILLVDDDKICNFIAESTLNRLGVAKEVHSALNGQEALDLFNGYFQGDVAVPDIIFLDLNMPIMDGFQFIDAFKKLDFPKKENILIVILTSSMNPQDIQQAKSLGIDHYMAKPINEEKIMTLLKDFN